ncbi:MAG: endolytic transglycosylase MltG [Bacteroidota bacterium]|nr:endolytic transglycosylase MltG [Bacteroidota bacterium]
MKKKWTIVLLVLLAIIIVLGALGYKYYRYIYSPNTNLPANKQSVYIYIPSDANYKHVQSKIAPYLNTTESFYWVAEKKQYPSFIKPGRYKIKKGMNNNEIINMLRVGEQAPVHVSFISLRTLNILAGKVASYLEPDSADFADFFHHDTVPASYGFDDYTFPCMFLPNTYQFLWNTSPNAFCERMKKEYHRFWNQSRIQKADKTGLSPTEISTLASIVEQESKKEDEKPRIAGVYINRLQKGMHLQADPTLIYATGNFFTQRVLNKHKKIDSPYNTYLYPGLPPGPICLPSISSIDAVLNFEKHDYLFFCAKPDISGYHNFAKTYAQHRQYAREYRQFLNNNKIYN